VRRFLIAFRNLCLRAEENPPEGDRGFEKHWIILALGALLSVYTALILGQDCTWDVMNYHFYSGFAFLAKPLNYDFAPAQVQSFFNPLQHVLSYLLLAYLPSVAVAVVLAAIQSLNFYLVFQISQVLFRKWPDPFRYLLSLSNAITGCFSSIFILELGTTFGDNLSSLFVLTGILLIFRHLTLHEDSVPASNKRLAIAGALLGVALGLKFTVAIYIAAIAVAVSVVLIFTHRRIRPLIVFFGFMGIAFVAVYGYWGYNLFREYHNPVFPYMNRIFQSPFYDSANLTDPRFFPKNWQQKWFYPFFFIRKNSLASEIAFRDIRLALSYIAVVLLAISGLLRFMRSLTPAGKRNAGRHKTCSMLWPLTLFGAISYILWQNQFSVYRYLIVLELLAPAFLALALGHFIKTRFRILLGSLLVNGLICLCMIPANFGRQKFDDNFLRAEIPAFAALEKSVVIMSGMEATSFIIPRFPPETRFIRISSNFYTAGQNAHLDNKIRRMLSQYDAKHTRVLIAEKQDMETVHRQLGIFDIKLDTPSCRPVIHPTHDIGALCETFSEMSPAREIPEPHSSEAPVFKDLPGVRVRISSEAAAKGDIVHLHFSGNLPSAVDLLYTINGNLQQPQKRLFLDRNRVARLPISAKSASGLYRLIGIRNSTAASADPWIRIDSRILIR
jgi:hypothetical protein